MKWAAFAVAFVGEFRPRKRPHRMAFEVVEQALRCYKCDEIASKRGAMVWRCGSALRPRDEFKHPLSKMVAVRRFGANSLTAVSALETARSSRFCAPL